MPDAGLPCALDDVLAHKCRRCHTTPNRHGAPVTFFTWEETQAERYQKPLYMLMGRVVETGYMPLGIQANPPVEPLTAEEKKVILDWVAKGAPKEPCEPPSTKGKKKVGTASSKASKRVGAGSSATAASPRSSAH